MKNVKVLRAGLFLLILCTIGIVLSCGQNVFSNIESQETTNDTPTAIVDDSNIVTLSIGLTKNNTRSVIYETISDISKFELYGTYTSDETAEEELLGTWNSLEDLKAGSIAIEKGTWNFDLDAYTSIDSVDTLILEGSQTVEITESQTISFTLDTLTTEGNGTVNISVTWPTEDLISTSTVYIGSKITGYDSDETEQKVDITSNDGNSSITYSDTATPDNYWVIVKLLDTESNTIGFIRKRVRVRSNLETNAEVILTSDNLNCVPTAPTNIECVYIADTDQTEPDNSGFTLTWTNNAYNATSFDITIDDGETTLKTSETTTATLTGTEITDLDPSTEYTFKIRATNEYGSSELVEVQKTTITLNSNNETDITSTISLYEGQTVSNTSLTPNETWTKDNCYFAGWTTSITGAADAITYGYAPNSTSYPSIPMPTEDQTFYAIWMPNYLTVSADIYIYATEINDIQAAISDSTYALVVTGSDYDTAASVIETSTTSIAIPEGVTAISSTESDNTPSQLGAILSGEFESLSTISLPESLKAIGVSAFSDCSTLTTINIPDNVSTIGSQAFSYCTSLTAITIPNSVTKIESSTFYYCTSLSNVTLPDTLTSIGESAYDECSILSYITIPSTVTEIGSSAFANCSGGYFTITLEPTTPPTIGESILPGVDFRTIFIPTESFELYTNNTDWSFYADDFIDSSYVPVTVSIADSSDDKSGWYPVLNTEGSLSLLVKTSTEEELTKELVSVEYPMYVPTYVPTGTTEFTITAYDTADTPIKYASGTTTVDISADTTSVEVSMTMDTATLLESETNTATVAYSSSDTDDLGVAFNFTTDDVGKVFIYEFSPTITDGTTFLAQNWTPWKDGETPTYEFSNVDLVVLDSLGNIVAIDDQIWTMSAGESVYLVFTPTATDASLAVTIAAGI